MHYKYIVKLTGINCSTYKMGNRTEKSILNAEVNILFYFLGIIIAFFSRKVFLDNLSADVVGLAGTITSILSLLNLSELGIGISVSYFLFKPIAEKNNEKISDIISLLGYLYRIIGLTIIVVGVIISLLFPVIFKKQDFSLFVIYFTFYAFLGSNVIGYFVNYRQILLDADQKTYLVSIYSQSFNLFKSIIQILLALYYKNIYIWVGIEFVSSLIQCAVLNWKINKEYPWLKTNKNKGRQILKQYPDVLKKTKQIVIHQMKDFILTKSDEIMIFAFVSLKMVAYYGNYVMIITKLSTLFLTLFSGMGAGIGNLVAEGNKHHVMSIFWQLSAAKYLTAGILIISLSFLINPIIGWWIGIEYELGSTIVTLFMINLYIMQTRSIVDMFNHSYGLYGDVWAAWAEGIINIIVTISIAIKWGIIGILLGKIISLFFIVVLWKPYYLYSQGFRTSIWEYWQGIIRYYICFIIAFTYMAITYNLTGYSLKPTLSSIVIFSIIIVIPTIIIYIILMVIIGPGTSGLLQRLHNLNNIQK